MIKKEQVYSGHSTVNITLEEKVYAGKRYYKREFGRNSMLTHLDYTAFQMVNHLAVTDKFLNPVMVFLAEKAEYLFIAGILFYWFFHKAENRKMVVSACLSACLALAVNVLIGDLFYRARPFVAHHVIKLIPH